MFENDAYVAGIIDGEGCFSIEKRFYKGNFKCFRLRITITNTNLEMLEFLKKYFDGGCLKQRKKVSLKHKQCYQLDVTSNPIRKRINNLLKYLIIKKRQGEIFKTLLDKMGRTGKNKEIFLKEFEENCLLYDELRALNKRGID